jgi:putative ABC transport system ATP-binding protein
VSRRRPATRRTDPRATAAARVEAAGPGATHTDFRPELADPAAPRRTEPRPLGALALDAVVKHYRGGGQVVRAVDGVTLTIEPGELVALYGPSGSGKSTLLMLAAALLAPDAGSVRFGGCEIGSLSARAAAEYRRREVALITQELHLIPGASALENAMIKLPVLGASMREARAIALPWLERLGLGARAHEPPERLSMGERQRVAIARALAGEPRLLLADEPTGSLDSVRTRETLVLLRSLCRERRMPGLLVTHDADARAHVDRVLALRDGRLLDAERADAERAGSAAANPPPPSAAPLTAPATVPHPDGAAANPPPPGAAPHPPALGASGVEVAL